MKLCEEVHSFLKLFSKSYSNYQEGEQKRVLDSNSSLSGSNCHLWFSLGLENSTSQAAFMGRFRSYFVSQKTETEVRTWTKHSPDGQSLWCHQRLTFLVCGQVETNLHFKAMPWEDGESSVIFFPLWHPCGSEYAERNHRCLCTAYFRFPLRKLLSARKQRATDPVTENIGYRILQVPCVFNLAVPIYAW